jgi:exopolyphosphatase/guanosine-5'-triphosphate,3'-diphosphate pyrophosphatase
MEIGGKRALFIDIGGGSTELIVGTQNEYLLLESLKLGAIRLGNRFLEGVTGPISPALYDTMRQYVRGVASHAVRKVRETGFDMAIASSGTAMNLAQVTAKRKGQDVQTVRNYALSLSDLTQTAQMLCKLSLEERRRVPGLNPERADIIISGAAVLQTIAEEMGISSLLISDRSLREGVLVDALKRRATPYSDTATLRENNGDSGVRRRSIERLLRLVPGEEVHARHVAFLTLRLFDQTRTLGLHPYGERERELLEYAALAHDIGIFVSHSGHHRHSFYLIRHSELAGFTDLETRLIANMAYFHRKSTPKKRHEHFMELSPDDQKRVRRLSALLRVAEGLDRSHLGLVKDVKLVFAPDTGRRRTVRLQIQSSDDPRLELWYVGSEREAFADAFGVELELSSREP